MRQDPIEMFAFNVRITERIWEWLDERDIGRRSVTTWIVYEYPAES